MSAFALRRARQTLYDVPCGSDKSSRVRAGDQRAEVLGPPQRDEVESSGRVANVRIGVRADESFCSLLPTSSETSSRRGDGQSPRGFPRILPRCVVVMKLSSVSRLVSTRGLGAWGLVCALGLVAGCGDDEGAANTDPSTDAAVSSGADAAAPAPSSSESPAQTSDEENPVNTDGQGGEGEDAGKGDASVDAGGQSACGGAGEPCCGDTQCGGGLVCVAAPLELPTFEDSGVAVDGGGFGDIIAILGDGGWLGFDGGIALPSFDGGLIAPPQAGGICEACGGEGERCCAEQACNDGFACEAERPGPNAPQTCVAAEVPAVTDGGEAGVPDAARVDAGGDAATECGGLDQPCCEGRGAQGVCGDGLECDGRPPRGLEGDVCVEG